MKSKAELFGKIEHVGYSLGGKLQVTLEFENKAEADAVLLPLMALDRLDITICKHREKRSLDANALAWVLIGKIAAETGLPKNDIYREFVRDLGGNYDTVCVKSQAAENLMAGWRNNGLGWITDSFPSRLPGCTNVMLYYGSSTYDRATMGRFLDNIIADCKIMGIETRTQEEIDSILNQWEDQ